MQSVLSAAGITYVDEMMAGDDYLLETSGDTNYGSDNYHIVFFGEPSVDEPWTLQFGGHHLAIHVSLGGDALSVSPYFKGNQPVSFEADGTTIEAMGNVRDDLFGLFESLDEDQLAAAELDGSYSDLVMGPGIDTGYPDAEGLAYSELTTDQQALVQSVIADYVADAIEEMAEPLVALYGTQLDEITIGWSTSIDRDSQAYMRIDGPRVWIEWVNTGNPGESGIHYHTVYRDKQLDYGTGTSDTADSAATSDSTASDTATTSDTAATATTG